MIRDSGVPSIHSVTIAFGALATTRGTAMSRVAGVGGGERALRVGLEAVVEFLEHALLQLGEQRLDLEPGGDPREQPRHARAAG